MLTQEIRRKFLKYFQERGHTIVPSSSVVPHDDPTLLFINAGMNQFKDVFLGKSMRDYTKAVSSQKCIRVGGKHNDLENVGHTLRHLTFFEMLGNFSFGDYFKKEAIQFAWEVSTEIFELDPMRIWPTVFREDEESFELWRQYVPAEKITRFDEKNNFWAMGDTGPCGPCSELLYDRGVKYGEAKNPLEDVNETRYLEFWNLVFMQYNRDEKGVLNALPKPSIDTGAGLERVVNLKMDVHSVYETDVLRAIIRQTEHVAGVSYADSEEQGTAPFRVIADHLRTLSFAISDGVQPSNVDRGYVLRKVLRRAVRYGRTLGMAQPFLAKILPALLDTMGSDYPELYKNQARIEEILTLEEESFLRTLNRGGNILNHIIEKAQKEKRKITGDEAFKLKDTYGFPIEEILLLARDAHLSVETERYAVLEEEARDRSRKLHKTTKQMVTENLFADFTLKQGVSKFLGYIEHSCDAKVLALVANETFVMELSNGMEGVILLDRTPFYAEMGGQVGDIGALQGKGVFFEVETCESPFKGLIAHIGKVVHGSIKVGDILRAEIDAPRRQKIANNHTATHLLHWSLQKVLGEHVKQAGSVVEAKKFRFDFSHHKALTKEEVRAIEDLVNDKIRENLPVKSYELELEQASKREDIKQFFGEKYDKVVRVVDIDFSKELCGGTHTSSTGNIGLFRIAKEGSIAAGVRRIEGVTGQDAEALAREQEDVLLEAAECVKTEPQKLISRIEKLLEENKELSLQIKNFQKFKLQGFVHDLLKQSEEIQGVRIIIAQIEGSSEDLRLCAEELINQLSSGVVVLGSAFEGKCQLIVCLSDDLVKRGLHAKEMIASLAKVIGGGGGGKATSAQAGGRFPEKLDEALNLAREFLRTHK